jgi:aldehyde dehydrogenase (NAD+)
VIGLQSNIVKEASADEIKRLLAAQKDFFESQETKPAGFRLAQLQELKNSIKKNEQQLISALREDLGKSELEAYSTEIGILYEEIGYTLKHLKKWIKAKKVKTAMTHIGSKGYIIPEPYGSALIIAPWNYPVQLALSPLIGAIAAGNTAVIKPSELTPNVSRVLAALIKEAYPEEYISTVEGGVETSQQLLGQPFDYIFFTGSVPVGKLVMEAASKSLIPVTLELGGKSPVIVHEDANISLAAKRIVFGKFTNAGQTCIAPDYMFVHEKVKQPLLEEMKKYIKEFYSDSPLDNEDYSKIVNSRHFSRLEAYLSDGQVLFGGRVNGELRKMEPTLIDAPSFDSPVMQDEIFGPILPVYGYANLDEAISFIQSRPKPLALYLFTGSQEIENKVNGTVSFGGGCINDTLMHIATPYLPFGGVGESGIGSYHGMSSFGTFSHYKSVLKQTTLFDFSFRYPSAENGLKLIRKLMK